MKKLFFLAMLCFATLASAQKPHKPGNPSKSPDVSHSLELKKYFGEYGASVYYNNDDVVLGNIIIKVNNKKASVESNDVQFSDDVVNVVRTINLDNVVSTIFELDGGGSFNVIDYGLETIVQYVPPVGGGMIWFVQ